MDATKQPGIRIGQVFLVSAHFEHVGNPAELPPNTPIGEIGTSINVGVGVNDEEKVGFVSVTLASAPESKGLYRFRVEMAAIIEATDEPNMPLREFVVQSGPAMLYPFIRETVATLTSKGRFGPVWIPPINLAAITASLTIPAKDTETSKANKAFEA